jgi:hypothetical protein
MIAKLTKEELNVFCFLVQNLRSKTMEFDRTNIGHYEEMDTLLDDVIVVQKLFKNADNSAIATLYITRYQMLVLDELCDSIAIHNDEKAIVASILLKLEQRLQEQNRALHNKMQTELNNNYNDFKQP